MGATESEWPDLMRSLVGAHGVGKVWRVGLAALGYPPTWVTMVDEFQTVKQELER
jgi:hypothetical protein